MRWIRAIFPTPFHIVFLVVFWSLFFIAPSLMRQNGPPPSPGRGPQFWAAISPYLQALQALNIPLFFLNSEVLMPRILRRKGIVAYLISLVVACAAYIALQHLCRMWIIPDYHPRYIISPWVFNPMVFVLAVSIAYRLVADDMQSVQKHKEQERERLQSELSLLRAQISPHFMFNVLNSIVSLARMKSDLVEPVTHKLSELMRYMLYESKDTQVTLAQELNYLKSYIDLQKIRFEDDVEVNFTVESMNSTRQIEPMLLIPFVENAFKHGVGLIDDAVIDIYLMANQATLYFRVRNKYNTTFSEEKDPASGIGLKNVRRRLELLYPNAHRLDINQTDGWFSVELALSFRERIGVA
ncbi:MAG: histidine kinase [Spirosomataceae bacterium]